MKFVVVGCSHHTATLDLRERLAFDADAAKQALERVGGREEVDECMLISTCNRVEFYAVAGRPAEAEHTLVRTLAESARVDEETLGSAIYRHVDDEAIRHIFRVASSLDSLVVGEPQIVGQVKDAFAAAVELGASGALLGRCMQRAFQTAKRVRNETEISRHPASVSSVAVQLANRIFDDLSDTAVLVIGAGEMAELALRHLVAAGAARVRVANRSAERAAEVASEFSASPVPFESLEEQLEWADIVISSTGSKEPIVSRATLQSVMRRRKQRTLFIVDIAVPRDFDPKARSLSNVYLFGVDDLEKVVAQNLKARRKQAKLAEPIVQSEVEQFLRWLRTQEAVPVIKELRQHFSTVAHREAERAARRLQLNGHDQRHALDDMADAIVKKLLHGPSVTLKQDAGVSDGDLAIATRKLFGLGDGGATDQDGSGGTP